MSYDSQTTHDLSGGKVMLPLQHEQTAVFVVFVAKK